MTKEEFAQKWFDVDNITGGADWKLIHERERDYDEMIATETVKVQTAFQKHLGECSKGFYGRLAAKKASENEQLKKQIEQLKKEVNPQWA